MSYVIAVLLILASFGLAAGLLYYARRVPGSWRATRNSKLAAYREATENVIRIVATPYPFLEHLQRLKGGYEFGFRNMVQKEPGLRITPGALAPERFLADFIRDELKRFDPDNKLFDQDGAPKDFPIFARRSALKILPNAWMQDFINACPRQVWTEPILISQVGDWIDKAIGHLRESAAKFEMPQDLPRAPEPPPPPLAITVTDQQIEDLAALLDERLRKLLSGNLYAIEGLPPPDQSFAFWLDAGLLFTCLANNLKSPADAEGYWQRIMRQFA